MLKLRSEVPTALNFKITVLWNVMLCTSVQHSQTFAPHLSSEEQERMEVITRFR